MSHKLWKVLASGAMLTVSGAALCAQAQDSKVDVGVLTCQVEGGSGFIFGSSKNLTCDFEMASGKVESYSGRINKFGLDIGFTNATTISWGVLAPNTTLGNDTLAGTYVGASAEASAGVGGGANILIGGSQDTISLQPLSVQGQTGLNAALGVAELILDPA